MRFTGLDVRTKDRGLSKLPEPRIARVALALGCALTLAANPAFLIASEASQPAAAGPAPAPSAQGAPPATAPGASGASGISGTSGASGAAGAPEAAKLT